MEVVRTACPLDCWDACSVLATVADGRVVKLEGDPSHPITRGVLCTRTYRYPERAQSEERLLQPMRRRGDRFEPGSWDEALTDISSRLEALRGTGRTRSILHVQSSGSMGVLKQLSQRFWNLVGGVTTAEGDFCLGAGKDALAAHLGDYRAHDWDDLVRSRLVVLWGRDPFVSGPHRARFLKEARDAGARIVSINPISLGRSNLVQESFLLRPGSDHHFAMAVAFMMLEEGLISRGFVEEHTEGFEEFRRSLASTSFGAHVDACGIDANDIRRLAHEYATASPAAILLGTGPIRYRHGLEACAWITALPALAGYYGVPGGGLSYSVRHLRDTPKDWTAEGPAAGGRAISAGTWPFELDRLDPRIEMLWVNGMNPVATLPSNQRVAEAVRAIPFKVVVDMHWTDTARLADWVLPHPSFLEEDGLVSSWGHHWVQWMQRAVQPLGESRTDLEIFQALAERLGFGAEMAGTPEAWSRRLMGERLGEGEWETLLRGRGHVRSRAHESVPWEGGSFATSSGRYRFPTELAAEVDVPRATAEFPHLLLSPKSRVTHLSQVVPSEEPDLVSGTAARDVLGEASGSPERVYRVRSRHGEIRARLRVDPGLQPGLVVIPMAGSQAKGTSVNLLTGPECARDGVTCAYFDCPVMVELA